jgi:hypothetical protein
MKITPGTRYPSFCRAREAPKFFGIRKRRKQDLSVVMYEVIANWKKRNKKRKIKNEARGYDIGK